MGWTQSTIWNNIFKYAYPIAFLGSMAYCVMTIMQVDLFTIIANRNIVIALNVFVGLCGFFSFAAWYSTDLSWIDGITKGTIDLDTVQTKAAIVKSN
jgi:hypothetical protein